MKKSYVIFICVFDLGDGSYKIFVNAAGNRANLSPDMSAFLDYLLRKQPADDFTRSLEKEVLLARKHPDWSVEYMTMKLKIAEERAEAKEEGRLEGLETGRAEGIELQKKIDSKLIAFKDKAIASKDREIAELKAKIDYYNKLEMRS